MKTISRYIMTLALLITAVGGAWAQTQWTSGDCTVTLNNGTLTVSGKGAMADYTQSDKRPWDGNRNDITSVVVESGVTSVGKNTFESFSNLTSVTLPEDFTAIGPYAFCNCSSLQSITIPSTVTSIGEGAFEGCSAMTSVTLPEGLTAINGMTFSDCSSLTSVTIPSTVTSIGTSAFKSCSSLTSITIPSTVTSIGDYAFMKSSAISDVNLYANPDNLTWGNTKMSFKDNKATQCHVLAEHLSAYQNNFSSVNVTFVGDLEPLATPIEVTTNKAEGETTFTEASFTMPAFDATAEYELVRDMSVQMTTKVGNAADGADYRIRIKKDNQTGKFVPAEMNPQAMAGLITVTDDIEEKTLTNVTDYTVSIFAVDGDNNPTGNAIAFADLVPGRYVAIATAADGSAYDGATEQSNVFVLFQGYEIEVPAGEFATFYKDEALGLGEEHYTAGAALYTITDVNGTTATATELEITTDEPPLAQVAPAYTPLLVYNGSDEDMRVLLIPTTSSATVSHFSGFTGSLESQTLWGGEGFYACNGKQFVYVKNDLTLPANKCCLKITSGNSFEQGSRSITIVFDDATKITNTNLTNLTNGDWYDLNGRKLDKMPTKKGVYILNGKKVVVK